MTYPLRRGSGESQRNESCRTILLRKEQDPVMITKVWQRIHFYPRQKPLPNGDRRDAGIGLTSSEFFTSRHSQFFIVCAERLDLFQRHIFQCQHDIVSATRGTD